MATIDVRPPLRVVSQDCSVPATSGRVSEFEGLGWKAKFSDAIATQVSTAAHVADLMVADPNADRPNLFEEAFWQARRPSCVLTDKTAKSANDTLNKHATIRIATAIRRSMVCGRPAAAVEKPEGLLPGRTSPNIEGSKK